MENDDLTETSVQATDEATQIRLGLRGYGVYLIAYALGSVAIALGFAALGPKYGAALLTPLWVIFIVLISLYAARQQLPGLLRLHAVMLVTWAVIWMTALLGSIPMQQARWWWIAAGVAMALPPLTTRLVFLRRLRRRLTADGAG
jgi:hypothetical protein